MKFKLPVSVYLLVGYCALYTGVWGGVMLFSPQDYFDFANMTPDYFPPSTEFWGWFGISGGLFYGLYLFFYQRLPYLAIISSVISLAGTISTTMMYLTGPLTGKMASIHISGDVAGTIGFAIGAWLEYSYRRNQRVAGLYFEANKGESKSSGAEEGESPVDRAEKSNDTTGFRQTLKAVKTQKGATLAELSQRKEVMLVFLRHFGCTFCLEALADLKERRTELAQAGKEIVVVHMVDEPTAAKHIAKYGLEDLHRISDPEKRLYEAFELQRASFQQAFGLRNWVEGFRAGILKGHLVGKETGDGWQMPGVFLLKNSTIKRGFRHESAADRPDYCLIGECEA